jgi:hypothetical protein
LFAPPCQTLLSLAKLTALASGQRADDLEPVLTQLDHAMAVVVAQVLSILLIFHFDRNSFISLEMWTK